MGIRFRPAGSDSLIVEFESENCRAVDFYPHLKSRFLEITPCFNTLLIRYGNDRSYEDALRSVKEALNASFLPEKKEVPVLFGGFEGLSNISRICTKTKIELVSEITSSLHKVCAVGTPPGSAYFSFPYRFESSEKKIIKAGSLVLNRNGMVLISDECEFEGCVIGKTYLKLFAKEIEGYSYLKAGDLVKFISIEKSEFIKRGGKID